VDAPDAYRTHREVLAGVLTTVCRRHHLSREDSEDFSSEFYLRLVQDDYAVFRQFQGRSSLKTYLLVVVTRAFQDWRNALWGKWRNSAEAKRLGNLAQQLERLTVRDGLTLDEAHQFLEAAGRGAPRSELAALAARFPVRPGRHFVSIDELIEYPASDTGPAQTAETEEARMLARLIRQAVASTVGDLDPSDRLILRMRFEDGISVADIARALGLEQKPLYRRIDRLLDRLRSALAGQGVSGPAVVDLLERGGFDALDQEGPDVKPGLRVRPVSHGRPAPNDARVP
jgi:RNA polymerase sigma factor for flagellar operon FliA